MQKLESLVVDATRSAVKASLGAVEQALQECFVARFSSCPLLFFLNFFGQQVLSTFVHVSPEPNHICLANVTLQECTMDFGVFWPHFPTSPCSSLFSKRCGRVMNSSVDCVGQRGSISWMFSVTAGRTEHQKVLDTDLITGIYFGCLNACTRLHVLWGVCSGEGQMKQAPIAEDCAEAGNFSITKSALRSSRCVHDQSSRKCL